MTSAGSKRVGLWLEAVGYAIGVTTFVIAGTRSGRLGYFAIAAASALLGVVVVAKARAPLHSDDLSSPIQRSLAALAIVLLIGGVAWNVAV